MTDSGSLGLAEEAVAVRVCELVAPHAVSNARLTRPDRTVAGPTLRIDMRSLLSRRSVVTPRAAGGWIRQGPGGQGFVDGSCPRTVTPIWLSAATSSMHIQCSATIPFSMRKMWICSQSTVCCVGATP